MALFRCAGRKRFHSDGTPYCQHEAHERWTGRCPSCGRLYNIDKVGADAAPGNKRVTAAQAVEDTAYISTGMADFDRVIGGGLVAGCTILFGGSEGAGKSSLMMATADQLAKHKKVLYASGEESDRDVLKIAHRLGITNEKIEIMGNALDVYEIIERCKELKPILAIFDSLQVITCDDAKGAEASVSQEVAVANVITGHCKQSGMASVIINHMTKAGEMKGTTEVRHLVDTVLYLDKFLVDEDDDFAGDYGKRFAGTEVRVLEVAKNRNGAENLSAFFEMTDHGLSPIQQKSKILQFR